MYNEIFDDTKARRIRLGLKKKSNFLEAVGMFCIFLLAIVLCALISLAVN